MRSATGVRRKPARPSLRCQGERKRRTGQRREERHGVSTEVSGLAIGGRRHARRSDPRHDLGLALAPEPRTVDVTSPFSESFRQRGRRRSGAELAGVPHGHRRTEGKASIRLRVTEEPPLDARMDRIPASREDWGISARGVRIHQQIRTSLGAGGLGGLRMVRRELVDELEISGITDMLLRGATPGSRRSRAPA